MYYALTVNGDRIITGVHESLSVISTNMFISNPNYADDEVIVIDSPAEFESDMDIRCYNEDGTLKPLLWRIENGYTPLPFDKEIINGELVDKEVPAEEQPKSLMEYLDEQFAGARKESSDCIDAVKAESNARVQSMKPLFTELVKGKPADVIIRSVEFILPWSQGKYILDDIRMWEGQPKRCCQAHDSTANSAWTPAVASLWSPFHATSRETALPWIKPTGAHDMYKANEYMVFTDGGTYRCIQDTAYSPTEYAQAWERVAEAPAEGDMN